MVASCFRLSITAFREPPQLTDLIISRWTFEVTRSWSPWLQGKDLNPQSRPFGRTYVNSVAAYQFAYPGIEEDSRGTSFAHRSYEHEQLIDF